VKTAESSRPSLDGKHFDVIVIGGGINGVAIARECARGGRSTLIVEQSDFAAGTTSRATRIIHGGLRYLEHGEIGLVRESLRERQRLLHERPHLVRPIQFLLALDSESSRSALEIRIGLWLYRRLAGSRVTSSRNDDAIAALERLLDSDSKCAIFDYADAQCEFPERLVAEWLVEAAQAGAAVRNHAEVLDVEVRDGQARAVRFHDRRTNDQARVEGTWIINAAGPWADRVCQAANLQFPNLIAGVRGSHIVLPKFPDAPEAAIYTEAVDGRPIFLIPWNGQLLLGTTEVADTSDPGAVEPTTAEIEYLLKSVRRKFPRAPMTADQVQYAYAGVRPLPATSAQAPSSVTRRHFLHDHSDEGARNFISVIGGKLTTAASLARECARKIGIAVPEPSRIASETISTAQLESCLQQWAARAATEAGIPMISARAVANWHGRHATGVIRLARSASAMREKICPHTDHIVAEAVNAFSREHAGRLADALLRRVPVALGACWSDECGMAAAERVGRALGWPDKRVGTESEGLSMERAMFLRKPAVQKADLRS